MAGVCGEIIMYLLCVYLLAPTKGSLVIYLLARQCLWECWQIAQEQAAKFLFPLFFFKKFYLLGKNLIFFFFFWQFLLLDSLQEHNSITVQQHDTFCWNYGIEHDNTTSRPFLGGDGGREHDRTTDCFVILQCQLLYYTTYTSIFAKVMRYDMLYTISL